MFGVNQGPKDLLILLYHGVTNVRSFGIENWSGKHMHSDKFIEDMKYIKRLCNPISIDAALNDECPDFPVVVTFDDGFENNHSVAAHILDDFNIPATFYITAGVINTEIMFWVDILEDCINRTSKKKIFVDGVKFDLSDKYSALVAIKDICKSPVMDINKKNKIVASIVEQTGVEPSVHCSDNYKKMTWDQVREIHSHELFTIGGHSLYHDILSQMDTDTLKLDIKTCIGLINYNIKTTIKHFSYPEGQAHHYDHRAINILRSSGIVCSPSAVDGINKDTKDPFNLRRIMCD